MRGVQHDLRPVTPGATHTVECVCGFKRDVVAADDYKAYDLAIADHHHSGASMRIVKIPK